MLLTNCKLPTYKVLTQDQINKINENGFLVNHEKGEILFSQEKPISYFMFLNSGLVKVYKEEQNKKSTILKITGPGNYIGLFTTFFESRYQLSAMILEKSELVYVNLNVIKEVLNENGKYAVHIIQQLSNEGMFLLNKLISFPQKQIPGRVAEVLLFFSTEIYRSNQFTLPLSRQEFADLVYSTKESISRTISEFKNDRMIDVDDREFHLKSVDLLRILSKLG
jgi:CRP/FNR family transcriptional regulator, polysaccharide utilization system transcription regulator